jgi:hypothetical protein
MPPLLFPSRSAGRAVASDIALLCVALLMCEIVLRVLAPQPVHRLLRDVYQVRDLGFRYRPGAKTVCNNGFGDHEFSVNRWQARDREYGPKQPAEWRLLFVGDSFSENQALEVGEIYPNVLEANLASSHPTSTYSIVNAGMAGWDLWVYRAYLEEMLPQIQPDVVVIAMGAATDMVRDYQSPPRQKFVLWAGLPIPAKASLLSRTAWAAWFWNEMLEEHAHSYVFLRRLFYYPGLWMGLTKAPTFSPLVTDPSLAEAVSAPTRTLLHSFKTLCEGAGARFAILNVPRIYEVDREVAHLKIEMERRDPIAFDLRRPARLLREITTSLDIPMFDPAALLAESTEPTYFPEFEHWNASGNRIVAAMLQRSLHEAGLLEPGAPPTVSLR